MTTKKTIPFTLKAWKAGGIPVTRGGDPVYDLAHMPKARKLRRLVGVHDGDVTTWDESGAFFPEDGQTSLDLFLEVETAIIPADGYSVVDLGDAVLVHEVGKINLEV